MIVRHTHISDLLGELQDQSHAAHREVEETLPLIQSHGAEVTLTWLTACRTLFDFDRDAGRAFIRGSLEAERISETVLPWTQQALEFMRWRGSWRALEGFMGNLPRAFGSLGHAVNGAGRKSASRGAPDRSIAARLIFRPRFWICPGGKAFPA